MCPESPKLPLGWGRLILRLPPTFPAPPGRPGTLDLLVLLQGGGLTLCNFLCRIFIEKEDDQMAREAPWRSEKTAQPRNEDSVR